MEARANTPFHINAFSGRVFVKHEWRPVPAGCEEEAERNPYLETREAVEPIIDATDSALELAAENDLDLSGVKGSGVDGRIIKKDVEAML